MKNAGFKSGSREICLPQIPKAFNIWLNAQFKKNLFLAKLEFSEKIKGTKESLLQSTTQT